MPMPNMHPVEAHPRTHHGLPPATRLANSSGPSQTVNSSKRQPIRYASIASSSTADALAWMKSNLFAGSLPMSCSTMSRAAWRSS